MKYKGIVFDFNGTLFYDTPFHNIAWQQMVQEITGRDLDSDLKQKMHGKNNKEILYCIQADMSEEKNKFYSLRKEELYRQICLQHPSDLHLIHGATDWFDYLKTHHIPFTIASASIKENIDFFVETFTLDKWFDPTQIVYDDGSYEDKVAMFTKACEILNIKPEECIVIEDSVTGITHAKSAGIGCIIGIGAKEKHDHLKALGAHICIEDYHDIDLQLYV